MEATETVKKLWATLEAERKTILNSLAKRSETTLNTLREDGGWSQIQVVHHLIIAEKMIFGYVIKKTKNKNALSNSGWWQPIAKVLYRFLLRSKRKYKAPIAALNAVPETATLPETIEKWDEIRAEFKTWLDNADPAVFQKLVFRHPIFGKFSLVQTLDFVLEHQRRHEKQMKV